MPRRWEYATDWLLREGATVLWRPRHQSQTAILMEQAPGFRPRHIEQESLEETQFLREAMADAIDALEPESKWLIERLLIEGMSLRNVAMVLGISKTTVARRRDRLRVELMKSLENHPACRGRIKKPGDPGISTRTPPGT